MAFEQATTTAKEAVTAVTRVDSDGYYYTEKGPIREYFGEGDPNGVVTAPIGSRCTAIDTGKLWVNSDGSTTWIDQAA